MYSEKIQKKLEEAAARRKSRVKIDGDYDSSCEEMKKLRTHLLNLIYNHRAQVNALERIVAELSGGELDDDTANELRNYVASSETIFLRGKKIVNFLEHGKLQPNAADKLATYGRWYSDDYSLTRTEEGAYEFILPPLSSQYNLTKVHNEGRDLQQLVLYLIDEFMGEGNEFEFFLNATIEFYHYIDSTLPEILVPDADNVYVKKVIDCLHGFIIDSDNLLHLDLAHYGVKSTKSYTKMVVKKGQKEPHKTGI